MLLWPWARLQARLWARLALVQGHVHCLNTWPTWPTSHLTAATVATATTGVGLGQMLLLLLLLLLLDRPSAVRQDILSG